MNYVEPLVVFTFRGLSMQRSRLNAAIIACGVIFIASSGNLQAAELRLLAGGAMAGVWGDTKPQFEQASRAKADIFFCTTPYRIKEGTSRQPFHVRGVPVEVRQE